MALYLSLRSEWQLCPEVCQGTAAYGPDRLAAPLVRQYLELSLVNWEHCY